MLSEEAVKEFQMIYKAKFGVDISAEEAIDQGTNLLEFYKLVCKNEDGTNLAHQKS